MRWMRWPGSWTLDGWTPVPVWILLAVLATLGGALAWRAASEPIRVPYQLEEVDVQVLTATWKYKLENGGSCLTETVSTHPLAGESPADHVARHDALVRAAAAVHVPVPESSCP